MGLFQTNIWNAFLWILGLIKNRSFSDFAEIIEKKFSRQVYSKHKDKPPAPKGYSDIRNFSAFEA